MPVTHNEGDYLGDIVKGEAPDRFSRENIVVLAGSGAARELAIGSVLGKVLFAAPTEDHAGNTGDGAMGAITLGKAALVGDYVLTCVEAAANGGRFEVTAPDGNRLKDLTVGAAYVSDHINCTLADGAVDFIVGDKFTITVAAGSGKAVLIDFNAADGSQIAAGILIHDVTAPDGTDAEGVAIVRDAVIMASKLVWPVGATTDQKTAALAELAAMRINAAQEV